MNSLKETLLLILIGVAISFSIGFIFGEKSMCHQVGGYYSGDYGQCVKNLDVVRIK